VFKRLTLSFVCLLLTTIMLFNLTSCGLNSTSKSTDDGEVTKDFKTAFANFSFSLFKETVTKEDKNELISPLTAVICLALIANGAEGNTLAQIEKAFKMDVETLNENLYAFTKSLYSGDKCKVNLANSIWIRDGQNKLTINQKFLQTNADWYNADIFKRPFDESTLKEINDWCKEKTDGTIDEILEEIDDLDVMYLLSTLLFEAEWKEAFYYHPFAKESFTNYDKSKIDLTMLFYDENTYVSGDKVTGFLKNYYNEKYSFVGLLPNEDVDIYDFIASLDGKKWQKIWESQKDAYVHVRMPKFSYDTDLNLIAPLQKLGISDMFNDKKADFSKISENDSLYCSLFKQKTYIELDENGIKASSANVGGLTYGIEREKKESYSVILNRPFVYAIVDNATGLPLFIGAVTHLE